MGYCLWGRKESDKTECLTLSLFTYRHPKVLDVVDLIPCFPSDSDGKESACNVGDLGSIPGGGGHGKPLQDSCLENLMDR